MCNGMNFEVFERILVWFQDQLIVQRNSFNRRIDISELVSLIPRGQITVAEYPHTTDIHFPYPFLLTA